MHGSFSHSICPRFNGDLNRTHYQIYCFLVAVRQAFPLVCVDGAINTPDILAFHPRGEWAENFNPRDWAVNLNASVMLPPQCVLLTFG